MAIRRLGLIAFCLTVLWYPGMTEAAKKVILGADWVIYGIYAPYFVAREKRYYRDAGLEVQIERGYGAADSLKKVLAGVTTFGLSDTANVILSRAKGGKAKMLAVIYQKAPHVIYFLKNSGIQSPKDLEGRTVGYSPGDAIYPLFPAFAKINNLDASKVKWVGVEPAMKIPMLLSKKYEAITFYTIGRAQVEKGAAPLGGLGELTYADHGLNLYSNGIVATDAFISKSPDFVQGFMKASLKGFQDTFSNPEEAVKIMVKNHPVMNPVLTRAAINALETLAMTEDTRKHGVGHIDPARMKKTRDIVVESYGIKTPISLNDIYTTKFLK